MTEAKDWVAENILGIKRGFCENKYEGVWVPFYCIWCDKGIQQSKPCPKYPFPKFTMLNLMRKLGKNKHSVHVRYEPERNKNNFLVIMDGYQICYTDDPLEALCTYMQKHSKPVVKTCDCCETALGVD